MDSAPMNTLSPSPLPSHETGSGEPDGAVYPTYFVDGLSLGRTDRLPRPEPKPKRWGGAWTWPSSV